MRVLKLFLVFGGASLTLTFGAQAAELNTYRAGQAYLRTAATDFRDCQAQCQGDAACRGWNFIKPGAASRSGICEFNARLAEPVENAMSVSGEILTDVDAVLSRAVPSSTHTVRIGTPVIEVKRPVVQARTRPVLGKRPSPSRRMVRRQAVPHRPQAQSAAYGRTLPARPRGPVGQNLYTRLTRAQVLQRHRQAALRQMSPSSRPRRPAQTAINQPPPPPPSALRTPVQNAPAGPQRMRKPIAASHAPASIAPASIAPAPIAPAPVAPAPIAPTLYGSLNDDLTQNMTPAARPAPAPDNPADPDAPISTVIAAPTTPVESKTLVPPSLAGG